MSSGRYVSIFLPMVLLWWSFFSYGYRINSVILTSDRMDIVKSVIRHDSFFSSDIFLNYWDRLRLQKHLESFAWFKSVSIDHRFPGYFSIKIDVERPKMKWTCDQGVFFSTHNGTWLEDLGVASMANDSLIDVRAPRSNIKTVTAIARSFSHDFPLKLQAITFHEIKGWSVLFQTGHVLHIGFDLLESRVVLFQKYFSKNHQQYDKRSYRFDMRHPKGIAVSSINKKP